MGRRGPCGAGVADECGDERHRRAVAWGRTGQGIVAVRVPGIVGMGCDGGRRRAAEFSSAYCNR